MNLHQMYHSTTDLILTERFALKLKASGFWEAEPSVIRTSFQLVWDTDIISAFKIRLQMFFLWIVSLITYEYKSLLSSANRQTGSGSAGGLPALVLLVFFSPLVTQDGGLDQSEGLMQFWYQWHNMNYAII